MIDETKRMMLKERINLWINSGQMPKGDILEQIFYEIYDNANNPIKDQIKKYRDKKQELLKQYNEVNENLAKLVDEYYDEFMKKL